MRYRKNANGICDKLIPTNFNELHPDDGIKIDLPTNALRILLEKTKELYALLESQGIHHGEREYVVADSFALLVTDANKALVIKELLDRNLGEDVWHQFASANPDIATRLALSQIQLNRTQVLDRFGEMLRDSSLTEAVWQKFFDENKWIFGYGLRYQILNIAQSQLNYGGADVTGRGGERGDYLTHTEGEARFTCLVEIKRPNTPLLQAAAYRNGAYGVSEDLAGATAQVQANCAEWEIYGSRSDANREALPDVYTISPKGIVIIGRTSQLTDRNKRNSFERYRRSMYNPEIITFDELYERAKYIVGKPAVDESIEEEDVDFPF